MVARDEDDMKREKIIQSGTMKSDGMKGVVSFLVESSLKPNTV